MKRKKYWFLVWFLLKTCGIAGIAAAILIWILGFYRMTGNNMFPSIRDGDLCVLYKMESCFRNDVVLYEDGNQDLKVGRIVATGGQTVGFPKEGGYEVDGCQIVEENPYETYAAEESTVRYPVKLDEDSCFILNDFRSDTSDSRQYGPVDKTRIKGKLLFLLRCRGF